MATIPSPQAPALAQLLQWVLNPIGYMETNFSRFGDLFKAAIVPMEDTPLVMVSHPKAVQYLLTRDNGSLFSAPGEANKLAEPLFGKRSVILLSGKPHRDRRRLIMPPFHGERMTAYGELICQITRQVVAGWPLGETFTARDAMQTITMRVILQAVFGLHEGERYRKLEALLAERLDLASSPLSSLLVFFPQLMVDIGPLSPGGRTKRIVEETDQLLYAEIRDRRVNLDPDRKDVLTLLMLARDEAGNGLTDEELHDELMTLLVAGHETTATALAWALYWMHHHPEVRQKLLAERAAGAGDDFMAIAKRPYLTAVCNETLRIYPVALVTLPRQVEQPVTLMNVELQPGTLVMACIYLLHHHPELYPNSHQFRPERFLERQFTPYEFLPFGAGARRCVGAALAMYEMALVLDTILGECALELDSNQVVIPQRRGGTMAPSSGVRLRKVATLGEQSREAALAEA
ncbi:MAG: cytochrome P450 [Cyanobacteria bacterium P01_A01_bin.135]